MDETFPPKPSDCICVSFPKTLSKDLIITIVPVSHFYSMMSIKNRSKIFWTIKKIIWSQYKKYPAIIKFVFT